MSSQSHSIFVYGSLMTNQINYKVWPSPANSIEPATIPADLFDLGPYPGIVLGNGSVLGELHHVALSDWDNTIKTLDEFEEYYVDRPTECLYQRLLVTATTQNEPKLAWAYFLTLPELVAQLGSVFKPVASNESFAGNPCSSWNKYRNDLSRH